MPYLEEEMSPMLSPPWIMMLLHLVDSTVIL